MSRAFVLSFVIVATAATVRTEPTSNSSVELGATPQVIEYRLNVGPMLGPPGAVGLRVTITTPSDGGVVRAFEVVDEKPFHLFLVGRDLTYFRHLFPAVQPGGSLEVRESIPAGEYLVVAEFKPVGGARRLLRRIINVGGSARPAPASPAGVFDMVTNVRIQPLPFTLTAGERTAFHVMLSRTEDGRPLVNLEPYLGAGGYLLAVKDDLSEVVTARASTDGMPVSLLTFDMTFPKPGPYTVWVEFHRFGEPLAARFGVSAR